MCVDDHWQVRLPEVVSAVLAEPDKFRDLYRFTYRVSDDDGIDDDEGKDAGMLLHVAGVPLKCVSCVNCVELRDLQSCSKLQ